MTTTPHLVTCPTCKGTTFEPLPCAYIDGEHCACRAYRCETCDGAGKVDCEEDDCDVCFPLCTACHGEYRGCAACGETGLAAEQAARVKEGAA
jgi:hypothetical protein